MVPSIAIIPHALSPDDEVVQNEVIFLLGGVFNLGLIGLSASEESRTFLGLVGGALPELRIQRAKEGYVR